MEILHCRGESTVTEILTGEERVAVQADLTVLDGSTHIEAR